MGDDIYITVNGVKIRTVSIEPAKIEVSVQTNAASPVSIEIIDPNGNAVCTRKSECAYEVTEVIDVPDAKLWNVDTPFLYKCRVKAQNDVVSETFGIRELSWGEKGICINKERIIIQGACVHHDNGLLGAVCDPDAIERKVRLMKENGYNAIRSAHNPCSKVFLDECDRQGMLVMDEYIDHWYIHKTE